MIYGIALVPFIDMSHVEQKEGNPTVPLGI
jgi:hypothetical protein